MIDSRLLPYSFARNYGLLAKRIGETVEICVSNSTAGSAIAEAGRHFGTVRLKALTETDLDAEIAKAYAGSGGNAAEVIDEYESDLDLAKLMLDIPAV